LDLLVKGGPSVAIRITDDTTTLEVDNRVVATAQFSEHAAAGGHGDVGGRAAMNFPMMQHGHGLGLCCLRAQRPSAGILLAR
jgi:hypothetical protein